LVCVSIYHEGYETDKVIGVRIEYLPPYLPDLNPIEEAFSKIKYFLRRHQDYYQAETGDGMLYDMYEIMEIITAEDAIGYFMCSGYF
jgi:transposase